MATAQQVARQLVTDPLHHAMMPVVLPVAVQVARHVAVLQALIAIKFPKNISELWNNILCKFFQWRENPSLRIILFILFMIVVNEFGLYFLFEMLWNCKNYHWINTYLIYRRKLFELNRCEFVFNILSFPLYVNFHI